MRAVIVILVATAAACAGPSDPTAVSPAVAPSTSSVTSTLAPTTSATSSTTPASTTTTPTIRPTTTSTSLPTTTSTSTTSTSTTSTIPTTTATSTTLPEGVTDPPAWLGTRPLPQDESGNPVGRPTPEVLRDRRFTTVDVLPPPESATFTATVTDVPPAVADRSTWEPGCPVALDDLSYVIMTFWGFDHRPHTGEMIVADDVAEEIVGVFRSLFEARFPIEEMRVSSRADLDADPTGDGNLTESFVCRPVTGTTSRWSQHAFGLAIDINPFHNPYVKGDLVIPELAGAYVDRSDVRPGMIVERDAVTEAFDAIGWGWGGRWTSLSDPQHFSRSGH